MWTAGRELQLTLVYLALLCSLGSGISHPSTSVGGRGGGGKRLINQTQTAVGTGGAPSTKTRRASFVAAGAGVVGGGSGHCRGGEGCRVTHRSMHSPGMLGARLGASLRTPASRALATRSSGVVRLQGVRSGSRGEGGRRTKGNSSTVTAKEVAEGGHVGSNSTKNSRRSSSATAAVTSAGSASSNKSSRGAGGETAGKAKPGRSGAARAVGTAARARFDVDGYEYAQSLAYLSSPPERALKGVGPKKGQQLAKLGINTVAGLLWHLPTGIIDRRQVRRVADLTEGEIATVLLKVVSVSSRFSGPTRISCVDVDEQQLDIIIFGGLAWRRGADFGVGETKVVSGKVSIDKYSGGLVMTSPDVVAPLADLKKVMVVHPTYPLTSGLSLSQLKSAVTVALENLEGMRLPPEWIDGELMRERGWPRLRDALVAAHNPQEEDDLSLAARTRSRLAYDELLASQLVLAMRRQQLRGAARLPAHVKASEGGDSSSSKAAAAAAVSEEGDQRKGLVEEGIERLPFKLTQNQRKSLDEILGDMDVLDGRGLRMFRLLQGDVGSGKTAVAFLAMLKAAEQGGQSCMLAPTEVLTAQHLRTLRSMAEGIQRPDGRGNLRVELLTGAVKGKARQKLLEDVGNGEVDILVATHAVLASASTAFRDLGLAVVDEEQRFGVEQRDRLTSFAQNVLYLSATPIPRSLALAFYGDMEVSQLREMPEGSADITTTLIPVDKVGQIVDRLKGRDTSDDKVFWVLPQINKSDSGGRQHVASANERYETLVEQLGQDRVSLLHGKMSSAEKNKTLSEFAASEGGKGLRVLVSTSIIEVGVDVPRAGVCVVENAEMFGLSQLHQIRGRLGRTDRGSKTTASQENAPSSKQNAHCILLYGPDISDDATERLKAVRATRDGFLLAERDLELRGPGEMLGVQQKGYLEGKFKLADITQQGTLADHAYARARGLVDSWCSRREAGAADNDHMGDDDESDRVEGFGMLLALCGRGDDARGLLGAFSSGPRSGEPSSLSGSCSRDGEGRAAAAVAADAAAGVDNGGAEAKLPSVGASRGEELDGLLRFPSFLLSKEETDRDPVAAAGVGVGVAVPSSTSFPHLNHDTTPTLTAAAEATAALAEETISSGDGGRAAPSSEDAPTVETLFEDEADFLARSALEHAEMTDGQWGEGGEGDYLNPGFPISAAAASVRRAPRRAKTGASGGGFPSEGVSVRHGNDQPAMTRPHDDPQEAPLGAKGVHVWAGKPSDDDVDGVGASDGADVGEEGEEGGEESGASPEIIRRVDLSGGGHTVVLFDLETTGFRTKHDRIIQLAGKVMGSGDSKHSFSALVNPEGAYMSMEVRALTGITPEILAANDARSFREVWPLFAQWLSEVQADVEEASGEGEDAGGLVLVAHNAKFDNRFLVQEQARGGFNRLMMGGEMGIVAVVDSLTILRQDSMWRQDGTDWDVPRKPDRFNLSVLFKHLYGVDMPGAHTALGDVHGLESILSAPGISERWRLVASTTPSCQIPVPRSLEELQAATLAGPSSRAKKPSTRGKRFSTKSGKKGYSKRSS